MDVLKFLDDERVDEKWKNDPQEFRIQGLEAAIAEIERYRAALAILADDASWRQGGVCDPNSGAFRGHSIAQQALAGEGDGEQKS